MSKNRLVVYLLSGPAHLPYALVSIWSLRKTGYTGPVTLFAWPESIGYARYFESDDRLDVWASEREPKYRRKDGLGRNSQGLDRIDLAMSLDCDTMLYLDADTSVHGDITRMFDVAEVKGYCATQWCDWVTNNGKTCNRIRDLLRVESIDPELINEVTSHRWPSLNCGVFASKPDSPLLPTWYQWCKDSGTIFISDEKTQHLLMAKYPSEIGVLLGGAYNCSHRYQPKDIMDQDVVVYHYHGNSNTKIGKSPRAMDMWWQLWKECLSMNLANCNSWWEYCENKHLPLLTDEVVKQQLAV